MLTSLNNCSVARRIGVVVFTVLVRDVFVFCVTVPVVTGAVVAAARCPSALLRMTNGVLVCIVGTRVVEVLAVLLLVVVTS